MAKAKRKTLPKDFEDLLVKGDIEALKAVFDNCDVDARGGTFKQTALAFNDCPDELVRWLVERGADLSAGDSYGETPLHARAGHWKGRIDLLIELGADLNHDAGGRGTPLHRAAITGNLRTAQILLDHGARADAVNRNGQTPLVAALERCSNATIDRVAPIAELLLAAMVDQSEKPKSFVNRLFGGGVERVSPVTPDMQALVLQIGTNFEFHRAGFASGKVDAASEALNKLYALFGVPPVPRRTVHDGQSPITVKAVRWEQRYQELWQLLVPSSGAAATVQGEVIRISGRISDELERNGGANWDGDHKKMADAFLEHVGSAQPLPAPELDEARDLISAVKQQRGDPTRMCKLAVDWVALNAEPIKLPAPAYKR
jgi:hypothetical protein